MKKQNLFKIILFCVLGYVLLTWFIQAGTVSGSEVVTEGLTRIGLRDAALYTLLSFEFRSGQILFVLIVGAFFGVLSKSKKYSNLINKLSKSVKGIGWGALVILPFTLMLLRIILVSKLALWLTIVLSIADVIISGGLIWYGLKDNKEKASSVFGALSILPGSIATVLFLVLPKLTVALKIVTIVLAIALTILFIVMGTKKTDKKHDIHRSLFIVLPTSLVLTLGVAELVNINWVLIALLFVIIILTVFSVKFVNESNRVAVSYIAVFFVLLTAICGFNLSAFVFIPFFITIIIAMGYDRMSAFIATFGATLVGLIGSIFNYSVNGYLNGYAGIDGFTSDLIAKLALLIIPVILYVFFVDKYVSGVKKSDKEDDEAHKDIFELVEKDSKASTVGITITLALTMLMVICAVTGWTYIFNSAIFTNITNSVFEFSIKGHKIFSYILGGFTAFGNYGAEEVGTLLAIAGIVIILVARIKFSDVKEGIIEGLKKTIVPALVMALASSLFLLSYYLSPIATTIEGWLIGLAKDFNILAIFTTSIDALFGTFINGESTAFIQQTLPLALATYTENNNMLVMIFQSMFGIGSLVLPTSMLLVLGLEYCNIPYTKWIKTSWKTLIELFVVVLIILIAFFII